MSFPNPSWHIYWLVNHKIMIQMYAYFESCIPTDWKLNVQFCIIGFIQNQLLFVLLEVCVFVCEVCNVWFIIHISKPKPKLSLITKILRISWRKWKESDLNWSTHVEKLCATLKQRIGLLRRIKYKINAYKK